MNQSDRICPACLEPLPTADPRRKWCSANCRRLVSHWGGPLGYAELKEQWARTWERYAAAPHIPDEARRRHLERAELARRQAEALRAMG